MRRRSRGSKPHRWVALSSGSKECRHCGMRGNWVGARHSCRGVNAPPGPLKEEIPSHELEEHTEKPERRA